MSNLVQYQNDIIIDEITKEAYTSIMGAARICFGEEGALKQEYKLRRELASAKITLEEVEVTVGKGVRASAKRVPESLLTKWIEKYNPSLLPQIYQAGLRAYLYTLGGYKINASRGNEETSEIKTIVLKIFDEIQEIKRISEEYQDIKAKTAINMIGADQLLEEIKKQDPKSLPEDAISLAAWLKRKGVTLDKTTFKRLAILVGQTYRSLVHEDPQMGQCEVDGKMMYGVSVYRPVHFPILQIALNKLLSEL